MTTPDDALPSSPRHPSPLPHLVLESGWFRAHDAVVVKDVEIGEETSVWYGCVVRGDVARIRIGARTNLQDLTVVHPESGVDVDIGDDVTVGHRAILHGRSVGSGTLVGMGAILLAHSEIGEECIVAAGALVPERRKIARRSVVVGSPARVVRAVSDEEAAQLRRHAAHYIEIARGHVQD